MSTLSTPFTIHLLCGLNRVGEKTWVESGLPEFILEKSTAE